MKLLSVAICSGLLLWGQSPAPVTAPLRNETNQFNGRFWKTLNFEEKGVFVFAYSNAVDEVTIIATKGSPSSKLASLFSPRGLTGREIVGALDKFYDAPENATVAIAAALMSIAERTAQLDKATVEKILEDPCGN
jgi:hypothetical protein